MRLGVTSLVEPERPHDEPVAGYRLLDRLGRGGAGEVWEAEGPGQFRVAMKLISLADPLGVRERRTLEILRSISHPHLVVTFGSWIVDESLVIAMELADGTLWDRWIEARSRGLAGIPRGELIGFMADAAEGLDYLNEGRHVVGGRPPMSIQHRDVKPQNLLRFGDGVKVADLGMARLLDRATVDHTGSWSCAYAAPEFFENRTTRWSDQYSLAVTYCQLRAGRLPFGGTLAEMVLGHLSGNPDLGAVPELERSTLARALARDPEARWPHCRAFIEALRDCEGTADELFNPEPFDPYPCDTDDPSSEVGGPRGVYWLGELGGDGLPDDAFLQTPTVAAEGSTASAPGGASDSCLPVVRGPSRRPSLTSNEMTLVDLDPSEAAIEGSVEIPTFADTTRSIAATKGEGSPARAGRRRVGFPLRVATAAVAGAVVVIWTSANGLENPNRQAPPTPPDPVRPPRIAAPEQVPSAAHDLGTIGPAIAADEDQGSKAPLRADFEATGGSVEVEADSETIELQDVGESRNVPDVDREGPTVVSTASPAEVPPTLADPPPAPSPSDTTNQDTSMEAEAANRRGLARYQEGRTGEALERFNEALQLDPRNLKALENRGAVLSREGRYAEAIADFDAVLSVEPTNPVASSNRGFARRALGDLPGAIADYERALRLDPENPTLHFNLGVARGLADDPEGALDAFSEAIRLKPDYARAYSARGALHARLGDLEHADADDLRSRSIEAGTAP